MFKNILFIMCDQLRADYLSCYGHPTLETPHLDAIAARGVRFENAYIQAPVCGASRMSTYTGRYQYSNGVTYNRTPLNIGQWTMGDYLRDGGMRTLLVGKTHMAADMDNMQRLGIDPDSERAILARECGFEPFVRDDGLHPGGDSRLDYNQYLREQGYMTDNPWHDNANAGRDADENILSGWYMKNASKPAAIAAEHSETAYMTHRAMECIKAVGDNPWCIHLSYIKPHWPYIVPAPYHDMYSKEDMLPVLRHEAELENPHPVYQAFVQRRVSKVFSRDEVRETVIPAYMGLVKQIDDEIGRLIRFLDEHGQLDNTVIVFTSDHGDYLGDHWLGEKDYFHEQSIRVPLIIADPASEATITRGNVETRFAEYVDLVPTFIELAGGNAEKYDHKLEGHSLVPLLQGETPDNWRDFVIVETDFNGTDASENIDLPMSQRRATMLRTERYKYILHEAFPPQLFDLENDPQEFHDRGTDPAYVGIRAELHERLFHWFRHRKIRTTYTDAQLAAHGDSERRADAGIFIGYWQDSDE